MTEQPTALRLADALEHDPLKWCDEAAAELRRLYKLLMDMQGEIYTLGMSRSMEKKMAELSFNALEKQRDALLEALQFIAATDPVDAALDPQRAVRVANAAIKQAEGENT